MFLALVSAGVLAACQLTEWEQLILDQHNTWRAATSPPAKDMLKVRWDTNIAKNMASWLSSCDSDWPHSDQNKNRKDVGGYKFLGENLAYCAGTACPDKLADGTIAFVGKGWWDENKGYDYANDKSKGVTSHYTQMASSNIYAMGCAAQKCGGPGPWGWKGTWWWIGCQYGERGRGYWVGTKPYKQGSGGLVEPPASVFTKNPGLCKDGGALPAPATPAPLTVAPATASPSSPTPSTPVPATAPSTQAPAPLTPSPVTAAPSTKVITPVTLSPGTSAPATPAPSTPAPSTASPSTPIPSTPRPATPAPLTLAPVTAAPSTKVITPVTLSPATSVPATPAPSTPAPATASPSTPIPSTPRPATPASLTLSPVTAAPSAAPTPSTQAPASVPSTAAPGTPGPSTISPATPQTPAPAPAVDECAADPCGKGQTCKDPDQKKGKDFTCTCDTDANVQQTGSPSACTQLPTSAPLSITPTDLTSPQPVELASPLPLTLTPTVMTGVPRATSEPAFITPTPATPVISSAPVPITPTPLFASGAPVVTSSPAPVTDASAVITAAPGGTLTPQATVPPTAPVTGTVVSVTKGPFDKEEHRRTVARLTGRPLGTIDAAEEAMPDGSMLVTTTFTGEGGPDGAGVLAAAVSAGEVDRHRPVPTVPADDDGDALFPLVWIAVAIAIIAGCLGFLVFALRRRSSRTVSLEQFLEMEGGTDNFQPRSADRDGSYVKV